MLTTQIWRAGVSQTHIITCKINEFELNFTLQCKCMEVELTWKTRVPLESLMQEINLQCLFVLFDCLIAKNTRWWDITCTCHRQGGGRY